MTVKNEVMGLPNKVKASSAARDFFHSLAMRALIVLCLLLSIGLISGCNNDKVLKGKPSEVIRQCGALESYKDVTVEVTGYTTNMTYEGGKVAHLYDTDRYSLLEAGVSDYDVTCIFDNPPGLIPGELVTIRGELYAGVDGMLLEDDSVTLMNCEVHPSD